jgi:hypothetical protein
MQYIQPQANCSPGFFYGATRKSQLKELAFYIFNMCEQNQVWHVLIFLFLTTDLGFTSNSNIKAFFCERDFFNFIKKEFVDLLEPCVF